MSDQLIAEAACEVLATTAAVDVSETRRAVAAEHDGDDMIAFLSMVGTRAGTLALFCHPHVASVLAGGMLNMTAAELDDATVTDALGELVNQIGGTIKRKLAASGDEIMLSVPSVVSGSSMALKVMTDATPLAVDLQVGAGAVSLRFWQPAKGREQRA
jgi:CheY-specific phosphatase CheX